MRSRPRRPLATLLVAAMIAACGYDDSPYEPEGADPGADPGAGPGAGPGADPVSPGTPTGELSIVTLALPSGIVGVRYTATVSATGGTAPYAFTVVDGALPPGLALDAATGEVAGAPSAAGAYAFIVEARDQLDAAATRAFAIDVR